MLHLYKRKPWTQNSNFSVKNQSQAQASFLKLKETHIASFVSQETRALQKVDHLREIHLDIHRRHKQLQWIKQEHAQNAKKQC
jgi:hypothetical protein